MNPDDNDKQDKQQLRAAAEANLVQRPPGLTLGGDDAQRLLNELQVHQVELRMQNETLRQQQAELAVMRDRYVDLYDFAPVGYMTLTADGMIDEVNVTAVKLIGTERKDLLHRRFTFPAAVRARRGRQWLLFVAVNGGGAALNYGIYALLVATAPLFSARPVLAVAVGSAVALAVNFLANRTWVFRASRT